MQEEKYDKEDLLIVEWQGLSRFAIFVKESSIREKNIQVQLLQDNSKIWVCESEII